MITGYTWPYRKRLDNIGVSGGYFGEGGDKENRKYYRVWKNIDVGDEKQTEKFMKMLGDDAFKKLCMRVTLDVQPVPDTAVQIFIEKLKDQTFLFFTSQPQITNATLNQKPTDRKGVEEEEDDDGEGEADS